MKNNTKQYFKKEGQELQDYLNFRRRGSVVKAKKGKGSFRRKEKYEKKYRKDMIQDA